MFYKNPEMNHLVDLAAASPSNPQRYGYFRQAERIILEDAPCVFLGSANSFALRQPWLKGRILEPFGVYRLDRAWREP
jgi:peptide/nickel transport system substrate-binding protein